MPWMWAWNARSWDMRKQRGPKMMARMWMPWFRWCSSSLMVTGMYTFCLVRRRMSSLSIPPLPSEVLRERAMVSAVSDTMLADWAGTRKKEKLEGLSWRSQNTTPDQIAVARPAGIWMGRDNITINL